MNTIPEFYRTETWHPVSIHWPIVLLTIGTIFYIIGLYKNNFLYPSAQIMLWLGVAGAWLAVYTGNLADGIVSREICDPTVLKAHENYAYAVAYLFSGAVIADLGPKVLNLKLTYRRYFYAVTLILLLSGSSILIYVGHLGGQLVYQQAAGVYKPSEDCSEFE